VLRRRLGLTAAAEGEQVRLTPTGLEPLNAVVDYLTPHFIGLRAADGLYRFLGGNTWGWPIGLSLHLFADDVDQQKTEQAWHVWLDGCSPRFVHGDALISSAEGVLQGGRISHLMALTAPTAPVLLGYWYRLCHWYRRVTGIGGSLVSEGFDGS
jgi:hypothetical protein